MTKSYWKEQSREEFEKERKELIAQCFKDIEDPSNFIPYEEFDEYLELWKKLDRNGVFDRDIAESTGPGK